MNQKIVLVARSGPASLRLDATPLLLAFETLSSDPFGWNHGLALCVTARGPTGAGRISPCGPDRAAIRAADRNRPAYDMGCGDGIARVLFRPEAVATMESFCGQAWDEAAMPAVSGTWVVETPLARIEQAHSGGPVPVHRLGNTPPATTPLPDGWLAAAHVFPPHPARAPTGGPAAFDAGRHGAFQALLARHGRPDLWRLKQHVEALLAAGRFEEIAADRHGVATIRVTLRQALARTGVPPPDPWLSRYDRALLRALRRTQAN